MPKCQHLWTHGLLYIALTQASVAYAADFGILRSLQHGPIGDSPQYATIENLEAEAALTLSRSFGKYTINDDPDTKVSGAALKTRAAAGGAWAPSKTLTLSAFADVTVASDFDETQDRANPKSSLDSGLYRHEMAFFGTFRTNPLVFGGGLGLLLVGSETREFEYAGQTYTQEISSAAMPLLRLYGGISTKQVDATLGLRFFSMGEAVVEAQNPDKSKTEYDIVRRNPGEVHVDGRFKLGEVTLAGSLAYVLSGQASEHVDEFSVRFSQDGNAKVRRTGNARRHSDHMRIGVGSRFDPSKMVGVLGGISYIGAAYAEEQYASLEHENLGGLRLDAGSEVRVQNFRGFLHAAYMMDSTASYRVENQDRASTQIEQTQRFPLQAGDRVKVTQGWWSVAMGGGVLF